MRQLFFVLLLSVIAYTLQAQVTHLDTELAGFPNREATLNPTAGKKRIAEAAAQGKFTPEDLEIDSGSYTGAVITLKNDTVWGRIEVQPGTGIIYLQLQVTFIANSGNKYLYKPADLNGFIICENTLCLAFESLSNDLMMEVIPRNADISGDLIPVKRTRFFVQRLLSGPSTLYYVRRAREQGTQKIYTNDNNLFSLNGTPSYSVTNITTVKYVNEQGENIESSASVGFHLKNFYCIKKNGGSLIYLNPKKTLSCFSDNLELMHKISDGVYKYADMEKIVSEYNAWKGRYQNATEQRY